MANPNSLNPQTSAREGQADADVSDPVLPSEHSAYPFPGRQFCPKCGGPWSAEWEQCLHCEVGGDALVMTRPVMLSSGRPVHRALVLYFLMLSTTLLLILLDPADESLGIMGVEAADVVIVGLWLLVGWKNVSSGLKDLSSWGWYVAAGGLGVVTYALSTICIGMMVRFLGVEEYLISDPFVEGGYGLGMIVLAACLQPAIVEELAFRGIILSALREPLGAWEAIVVSALLFMVIHLMFASFPHLFVMGLALGYLRVRSGSLYPCMLLHFVHNGLCVMSELHGG